MIPLLVIALNAMFTISAYACPFCKGSLPNTDVPASTAVPAGFNNSIYFMFISLFSVMGFVVFTIVKGARSTDSVNQTRGFPLDE